MYTKLVANNKKAYHDYFVEDKLEAGIVLVGTEVKSIKIGKCSIKESYIKIENGEAIIYGMHVSPYEQGSIFNKDSDRPRKLLLHKREINKLQESIKLDGMTVVPLQVRVMGSLIKVDIGVAKGKKLHDKRQAIAEKSSKRRIEKELKNRQ